LVLGVDEDLASVVDFVLDDSELFDDESDFESDLDSPEDEDETLERLSLR